MRNLMFCNIRRKKMSKKRALISVSDKTGLVELGKELKKLSFEILSTGGTADVLKKAGIPVISVSQVTKFPECLDGRVKTLHPHIHAGILAVRDNAEHMSQLEALGIDTIDLVVINLYPFRQTILKEGVTLEEAIENIDIGGPIPKDWPSFPITIPLDFVCFTIFQANIKSSISFSVGFLSVTTCQGSSSLNSLSL
jgi:hypothetical protein